VCAGFCVVQPQTGCTGILKDKIIKIKKREIFGSGDEELTFFPALRKYCILL
jgi:hypothetical protein